MAEREAVLRNINNLAPKLYLVSLKLVADKVAAKKLLSECLSVLVIKTKGHLLALKEEQKYSSNYIYRQSLSVFSELLKNRQVSINTSDAAFYQLSLFQRYLLLLKYRLNFKEEELAQIVGLSQLEIEDQIFKAREFLEVSGQLGVEERTWN